MNIGANVGGSAENTIVYHELIVLSHCTSTP
jgi:hypothetical protein